jgi:glc operon protein GlcG
MALFSVEKTLTLAAAKQAAEAAEKFAAAHNWKMVIAVVDSGANLLYLERMDGGLVGSVSVAERKARTAVQFKCPTKDLETGLAGGTTSLLKLDILPFEGGIPILADGAIAGAIGASGGSPAQDGQVAQAGVDALRERS